MKHKWIILTAVLLLCLCAGAAAQVEINETNFPDGTFRAYVTRNFDSNGDKVLSDAEIALATRIDVRGMGIQSLQGIEYFAALEYLNCSDNNLTRLDVSGCTALEELICHVNNLTRLDVSGCTALEELICHFNNLTSLDVSRCTALEWLWCDGNNLTSLDVSRCTALASLHCSGNNLTSLDVSRCTALEWLDCDENNLTSLDVSRCTALYRLSCGGNNLTSLDVSGCTALEWLDCINNAYDIQVTSNGFFNLRMLPGNFVPSRAYNWTGGSVRGGVLTVNPGTERVTYTYNVGRGKSVTFTLNVKISPTIERVTLNREGTVICSVSDGQIEFTASLTPSHAQSSFTWTTSNKKVAKVEDTTGATCRVSLLKPGTATITVATSNGRKDSVTIQVGPDEKKELVLREDRTISSKDLYRKIVVKGGATLTATSLKVKDLIIEKGGKVEAHSVIAEDVNIKNGGKVEIKGALDAEKMTIAGEVIAESKKRLVIGEKGMTLKNGGRLVVEAEGSAVTNGPVSVKKGGNLTIRGGRVKAGKISVDKGAILVITGEAARLEAEALTLKSKNITFTQGTIKAGELEVNGKARDVVRVYMGDNRATDFVQLVRYSGNSIAQKEEALMKERIAAAILEDGFRGVKPLADIDAHFSLRNNEKLRTEKEDGYGVKIITGTGASIGGIGGETGIVEYTQGGKAWTYTYAKMRGKNISDFLKEVMDELGNQAEKTVKGMITDIIVGSFSDAVKSVIVVSFPQAKLVNAEIQPIRPILDDIEDIVIWNIRSAL